MKFLKEQGSSPAGDHAGPPAAKGGSLEAKRQGATSVPANARQTPDTGAEPIARATVLPRTAPAQWVEQTKQFDVTAIARTRRASFLRRLFIFILIPTFASAFYVFVYASPRYVAEFQIAYESTNPAASAAAASGLLASFLGGASAPNMTQVLGTYFLSTDFLTSVNKLIDLKSHYTSKKIDWWDRCCSFNSRDLSDESFVRYFTNHRMSISQQTGGYVIVDIEAFDPDYAYKAASTMIAVTDQMVTGSFQRPRDDLLQFAQDEVDRTMARFNKATYEVTKFQNEHHEIDVLLSASGLDTVVAGLQSNLAEARTQLADKRAFLSENSPAVVAAKAKIASLEKQIAEEQRRLASGASSYALPTPLGVKADIMRSAPDSLNQTTPSADAGQELRPSVGTPTPDGHGEPSAKSAPPQPYSNIAAQYAALVQEQTYAEASYVGAKQAYDIARAQAMHKQDYILTFVRPTVPQKAIAPDPVVCILGTFLASIAIFGVGSLLVSSFREHAGL